MEKVWQPGLKREVEKWLSLAPRETVPEWSVAQVLPQVLELPDLNTVLGQPVGKYTLWFCGL